MFDQAKNLMIGLFVIAALTIVVFILLFIHPMVGDEGKILRVRFANIDKINVGTRVSFGGKPVGEVVEIREIIDDANPRGTYEGHVYPYELKLAIDSSIELYNTDVIALRTSGLLGERSINITPLPPKKGEPLQLITDQIIYADESGSIEDVLKEVQSFSTKMETALDSLIVSLHTIEKEKTIEKISGSFKNIEEITASINKPEVLSGIIDNVHTFTEKILSSWEGVDEIIANVKEATNHGKIIFGQVKEGEGSMGKIIMSDEFYLKLSSVLSKAQTTMNDINHYGILFHLDKNWQRLRARRMNLLQKLCSPQEFRNFFNDEVDQISTSLSRVSMLLHKRGCSTICPNLVRDYEFSKVFSELLRRVSDVEEELNMYNIQLQDFNVKETELIDCR